MMFGGVTNSAGFNCAFSYVRTLIEFKVTPRHFSVSKMDANQDELYYMDMI